jgi:hypothetical protein
MQCLKKGTKNAIFWAQKKLKKRHQAFKKMFYVLLTLLNNFLAFRIVFLCFSNIFLAF